VSYIEVSREEWQKNRSRRKWGKINEIQRRRL
jgi:hypothetical protein